MRSHERYQSGGVEAITRDRARSGRLPSPDRPEVVACGNSTAQLDLNPHSLKRDLLRLFRVSHESIFKSQAGFGTSLPLYFSNKHLLKLHRSASCVAFPTIGEI